MLGVVLVVPVMFTEALPKQQLLTMAHRHLLRHPQRQYRRKLSAMWTAT